MTKTISLKGKSKAELVELAEALSALTEKQRYNKSGSIFPETGPHRRELYPKHMQFIASTKDHRQCVFMAGNRLGKSTTAAWIAEKWLTGIYPEWWTGKRFSGPITMLVAGKTAQQTRDICQAYLVGLSHDLGTGFVPKGLLGKAAHRHQVPGALDYIYVKHVSGGESRILFKSYDQNFDRIAGLTLHACWIDEEPPLDFYTECIARMVTTKGLLLCTCTPDEGLTPTVLSFLEDGQIVPGSKGDKYLTTVSLRDVPHVTPEEVARFEASIPPQFRSAKIDGIPAVGSGAVYPLPEAMYVIDPIVIPPYWPKFNAMDVGWAHATAATWMAHDVDNDIIYIYDEYKQSRLEASAHFEAMKRKGVWMPFVIDPAVNKTVDANNLLTIWRRTGLDLTFADNSVQAGITEVYQRLVDGRLKIFSNCSELRTEMRLYRYNDKGLIVKNRDDLVDCMRYGVMSGTTYAISYDEYQSNLLRNKNCTFYNLDGVGRNPTTGY